MSRIAAFMLLFLGLSVLAPALPSRAEEPAAAPALLRNAVTIDGDLIRVGDLFDGALPNGDVAVARAPAPGESIVLDARWLSAVARAYGLAWRPASRFDQTVVTRSSQLVGTEAIRAALIGGLVARGAVGELDIQFDGLAPTLKLPVGVSPEITVQQLNLDAQSGRFSAAIVAPADGAAATRVVLTGRVFTLTDVPVAVRRLLPGEVIREGDLEWTQVHADRVTTAIVVDPANVIGRAPRRPIRAGEPIRANDLQIATMLKRGTMVTMMLETPRMLITTQGRAMEDGAEGQLVNVMNTSSNRVVKALVVDPTTVSVASATAPLSN
jgi:flagella basal body P-ring formation protein FlgA